MEIQLGSKSIALVFNCAKTTLIGKDEVFLDLLFIIDWREFFAHHFTVMVLAVCVILPVNMQGTFAKEHFPETHFPKTTLVNLESNSDYIWVHLGLSFIFFPLSIFVMRRFSSGLNLSRVVAAGKEMGHTVMISQIPKEVRANPLRMSAKFTQHE